VLKPTPGELLAGVTEGLRTAVLPELADGHGRRQLKAALHALARLQRAWETQHAQVVADSDDMHRTLRAVIDAVGAADPARGSFVAAIDEQLAGLQAAQAAVSAAAQESVNAQMQALLITLDDWLHAPAQEPSAVCRSQRAVLAALFSRMVDRELAGSGVAVDAP